MGRVGNDGVIEVGRESAWVGESTSEIERERERARERARERERKRKREIKRKREREPQTGSENTDRGVGSIQALKFVHVSCRLLVVSSWCLETRLPVHVAFILSVC